MNDEATIYGYTDEELLIICQNPEPYFPRNVVVIRFKLLKRWLEAMWRAEHSFDDNNKLKATWEANGLYQAIEMLGLHPMYLINGGGKEC